MTQLHSGIELSYEITRYSHPSNPLKRIALPEDAVTVNCETRGDFMIKIKFLLYFYSGEVLLLKYSNLVKDVKKLQKSAEMYHKIRFLAFSNCFHFALTLCCSLEITLEHFPNIFLYFIYVLACFSYEFINHLSKVTRCL